MPKIQRMSFVRSAGTITAYREPAGPGVRVDSAAYSGWTIPPQYDSLIAKLVVWAPTRQAAIARLRRAIEEYVIEGVPTTLPLLRALCDDPSVINATYGTATLEAFARTHLPALRDGRVEQRRFASAASRATGRRTAPRLSLAAQRRGARQWKYGALTDAWPHRRAARCRAAIA